MKAQDVMVAATMASHAPMTVVGLGALLHISKSEVSNAIKRLASSHLLAISGNERKCLTGNLREFLHHGLKYVFPAHLGAPARGLATAWGHPRLAAEISATEIPVLPLIDGNVYGPSLRPLYDSLPVACKANDRVYELAAIIDCLRLGRSREISLALKLFDSLVIK